MKCRLSRLPLAMMLSLIVASGLQAADLSNEQRLERLERRMGQLSDLVLQVDALKRENSELRGQIELQSHNIESMKKRQRDLYIDIDQRLSTLSGGAPAAPLPPSTAVPLTPAVPVAPSSPAVAQPPEPSPAAPVIVQQNTAVSETERAEYNAAFKLLSPSEKRYPEAIKAFNAFLQKYPASGLADNAQYWLAEAHYVSQQNTEALQEFEKVVSQYPDSSKISGALLKIGYLQQAAGQVDEARQTLSRVVRDYPGTAAANMAKNRLQKLP